MGHTIKLRGGRRDVTRTLGQGDAGHDGARTKMQVQSVEVSGRTKKGGKTGEDTLTTGRYI